MNIGKSAYRPTAVDVVIIDGEKVVLVKRKTEPFKGKWVLPGGFVEINEDINQAAIREAKEETGMDVELVGIVGVYSKPARDKRHTVSVAFLAFPKKTEKNYKREEICDVKLFEFEEVPKLGFDHNEIVNDAINAYKEMHCRECSHCSGCE
ncbi:MAG: NUDIX hydrolase [Candidatus Micrarchaeota archaeon]|nr:NUDIX hydrolase [Candidatus Micrarchaeota archaeon]